MKIRNNYNECITNLACSIRKYFELEYNHNTLDYIDKLLEEKQPKNVIVMLFDGMGSRILDRTLNKDDFFIKNRYKEITTVFPATTTAANTSEAVTSGAKTVEETTSKLLSDTELTQKINSINTCIDSDNYQEFQKIWNEMSPEQQAQVMKQYDGEFLLKIARFPMMFNEKQVIICICFYYAFVYVRLQ